MNTINKIIPALALMLSVSPAWAVNEGGEVLFVAGQVTAQRDSEVVLKKNDLVYVKDEIRTAARSRGQLLMKDGAKIALRPETIFRIEEYFQTGDEIEQADGSVVVASEDSAVTELVKGGFRTITGAIGKGNPDAYTVATPAATLGIRGTHYTLVWCDGDCGLPPGIASATSIVDGLYLGVTDGVVFFSNNTGEYEMRAGEFVYVADRDTTPVSLPAMPEVLIDTYPTDLADEEQAAQDIAETVAALSSNEADSVGLGASDGGVIPKSTSVPPKSSSSSGSGSGTGSEGTSFSSTEHDSSTSGFDNEVEIPIKTDTGTPVTDGVIPFTRGVALASGPFSGGGSNAFTNASARGTRTLSGNDLTGFQAPLPGGANDSRYAIGTAGIRDDGFDPVTGFGWGRWTGGSASVVSGTSTNSIDLSEQSLHWVYGPQLSSAPSIPMTGTANFSLIVGNTDPTDTLGNSGSLGDATLSANFTNATVASEISLSIAGSIWAASGNGSIADGLFNGLYNSLSVAGQSGGNGNFSGFFGQPGSGGLPSGAGLTYGLTDTQGISVSGAVVFGQPVP